MKKVKLSILTAIALIILVNLVFISCKKNKPEAAEALQQPPTLPTVAYSYSSKHGVNDHLATLGRVLFYDKNLSVNNAISCGSCHKQESAFADNVRFNKGFSGLDLKRNSPSIQGISGFIRPLGLNGIDGGLVPTIPNQDNQLKVLLFWDGRQNSVADMVLNPVLNHNEMSLPDFTTLINKLQTVSYYPALFKNAYGDESITKERIAFAIEGFIACLNTPSTVAAPSNNFIDNIGMGNFGNGNEAPFVSDPFGVSQTPPQTLEEEGRFLFHNKYNCAKCHDPSNTGSYGTVTSPTLMFNIGLDQVYADNGLGAITGKEGDKGLFKVPTLKNISLTAPYMHDGRFSNLDQVLEHYSHNIQPNRNLSSLFLNQDGTPKRLSINAAEKNAIIAFLNTLKDDDFLHSPMYSDPFQK
jgi:cytochrome c peroxidase